MKNVNILKRNKTITSNVVIKNLLYKEEKDKELKLCGEKEMRDFRFSLRLNPVVAKEKKEK